MGRETLLDLGFSSGESVFGWTSRSSGGMPVPLPARAEEDRRTRDSDGDRNWLVQSLSLPTLGGGSSNAALAATSGGRKDSGWGWLANEVNAGDREAEQVQTEEELSAEEESWMPEGRNPYAAESDGRRAEAMPGARRPAGSEEESPPGGERDMDRGREMGAPMAARDDIRPAGAFRADAATPVPALPEMSQTREMLGDLMGSVKPDTGGWQGGPETWSSGAAPFADGASGGMGLEPSRSFSEVVGRDSGIAAGVPGAGRGGGACRPWGEPRSAGRIPHQPAGKAAGRPSRSAKAGWEAMERRPLRYPCPGRPRPPGFRPFCPPGGG